jgi:DNA polymerase-3 subunit gamma/tau
VVTALYRRYRPETFAELIGQAQVTAPLMTALRTDRVNHAYLFSGPRGCGKTTSARILARCLNCAEGPTDTPCGKCPSCIELARDGGGSLDVVEIDAASHNGVDDARDLRERAAFAPARDRFKIFILDEAHMVTPAGFNALLKLVEEPPAHVKFIFATTEPDKVISTIRSRTHHYPFRLVPPAQMLDYLEEMCKSEKVEVAPGVLTLVVRSGGGSVRDSLSLLDQLIAGSEGTKVTYERAVALLGYTPEGLLDEFIDALSLRDSSAAFKAVDSVIQSGQDPRQFVEDILERLRDLMLVASVGLEAKTVLRGVSDELLEKMRVQAGRFGAAELSHSSSVINASLNAMSGATSPKLHLELMVGRALVPAADTSEVGSLSRIERLERRIGLGSTDAPAAPAAPVAASTPAPAAKPATVSEAAPAPASSAPRGAPAPAEAPKAAAPAAAAGIPALTTAQFKDSWNSILSIVEKESKNAWVIAYTLQVVDYADEVLTLRFASQHDLETFKASGAAPDVLRRAILTELGVTVKFKPFVPESKASAPAPAAASQVVEPAAPTKPIEVVAEAEDDEPDFEEEVEAPVEAETPLVEAPAVEAPVVAEPVAEEKPAPQAKGKSRAADIPDEDRYGESLVRDLLGGIPLDDQPGAGR